MAKKTNTPKKQSDSSFDKTVAHSIEDAVALTKKLSKTKLYIERDILPKADDDEFYHIDLVGLNVQFENSQDIGIVNTVQDFGAGVLLEIKPEKGPSFYIPFTLEAVPDVQIDKGYITINPPNEVSERD